MLMSPIYYIFLCGEINVLSKMKQTNLASPLKKLYIFNQL